MTAGRETVVVTGLGATTPLGGDVASTWSAMLAGRSGVYRITEPWAEDLPVRIAAAAVTDPAEAVGRVQARRMDRCEQLALVAAREAWADAGSPEVDPDRLGVAVTSGIEAEEVLPACTMSSATRSRGTPSLRAMASTIRRFA